MATPAEKTLVQPTAVSNRRARFRSDRTAHFTESVIRETTRLAIEHRAVNLAQGYPDFSAPEAIKQAAREANTADFNQYAITWGAKSRCAAAYRRNDRFTACHNQYR